MLSELVDVFRDTFLWRFTFSPAFFSEGGSNQLCGMMASAQAGFSRSIANFTLPRHSTSGGRTETTMVRKRTALESRIKKAHLTAVRKHGLKLPPSEHGYHFSEFLSHPEGVESALNVKVAKSFHVLDDCTYRLVLPQIRLLSFDAFPVMDLRTTTTAENFTVEMLSFKFRGAEALESENDHLIGLLWSRIMWHTKGSESYLELKMELDMIMELVKLPFSLLPPAAVEIPGNMIVQAVVDNLTKELLENVAQDYGQWYKQQKLQERA
ncbi:unnamed protein product [Linum trigynum]|uniref:DUF1997 family protein n=1 Tax=Linum trigynum TaxID=586398 RepID=A0AAV2D1Z9_9ROSI